MLAHHYSIGLFDNLVYVKCPKCHKTLPLKGGSGGGVDLVRG
jgi:ssDNA-binding Zn-finger/Zn-ribbon topoisomerase 1